MAEPVFRKDKILDCLKKLYGLPPYDVRGNICRGDAYYGNSLEKRFGKPVAELEDEVGFGTLRASWESARANFGRNR